MRWLALATLLASSTARANTLEMIPQIGHSDSITETVFATNAGIALTASEDSTARVWDLDSHLMLRVLRGHSSIVTTAAISADGRIGITAGYDNTVRVWKLDEGREVWKLEGHKHIVWAVDVSADGKRAVSVGHDQQVIVWDTVAGKAIHTMRSSSIRREVRMSRDARWAISSGNNLVYLVDVERGVLTQLAGIGEAHAIEFSDDGRYALTAYHDIHVWDLATGTAVRTLAGDPDKTIDRVGFDRDRIFAVTDGKRTDWAADGTSLGPNPAPAPAKGRYSTELVDGETRVVDATGRQRPWKFESESGSELHGAVVLASDRLASATDRGTLAVWNWRSLRLESSATYDHSNLVYVGRATLGATNAFAIVGGVRDQKGAHLLRLPDQKRVAVLGRDVRTVAMSPDGRRVVLAGPYQDHEKPVALEVWDPTTRTKIADLAGAPDSVDTLAVSQTGDMVFAIPGMGWPVVFDVKASRSYTLERSTSAAAFSPDGKRLAVAERDLTIIDAKTGTKLASWPVHGHRTSGIAWSPDGSRIATAGSPGTRDFDGIKLWSDTGQLIRTYEAAYTQGLSVAFSPDGKYLASGRSDGTVVLWRVDTGDHVVLATRGRDWLVYSPDGYFDASANGGSLVAVARGLRAYRADQLAATRNRPDILLRRMGLGTPDQVSHYQKRFESRIARLGLAASAIGDVTQAPVATIASVEPDADRAKVRATLEDPDGTLRAYNIFVNDVPLYPAPGRTVSGPRVAVDDAIELGAGANQIEISVIDASGIESLRDVRTVEGPPARPRDLYFVGFGVSKYRDTSLNLGYAHKDALDLEAVLRAGEGRAFRRVHSAVFVDGEVTAARFREAQQLLAKATVDDTVVVFIAGHGTYTADASADYVFLVHDVDLRRLRETAVSFATIEQLLAATPSRRKLLLMDTCESGERESVDLDAPGPTAGTRARTTRSLRRVTRTKPRAYLLDRDRYIYQDVFRRTGTIVFSSSRGSELSWELDTERNGAFTAAIKRALTTTAADRDHDGTVSTDELRAYVPDVVAGLTADRQHPTVDRDNRSVRVAFPIATGPIVAIPHAAPRQRGCACDGGSGDAGLLLALLAWLRRGRGSAGGAVAGSSRPGRRPRARSRTSRMPTRSHDS